MWSGGFGHASWKTLWAGEFFPLLSFLFVASVLWHAWVGVRNITMDYLKPVGLRVAVQSAVVAVLVLYLGCTLRILCGGAA